MRFEMKLTIAAVALAAVAGCAPVDPGLGEALRYDMAAQTVNPDPVYPEDAHKPGDNGEKAQKATERYRKGQIKTLRTESTSNAGPGN